MQICRVHWLNVGQVGLAAGHLRQGVYMLLYSRVCSPVITFSRSIIARWQSRQLTFLVMRAKTYRSFTKSAIPALLQRFAPSLNAEAFLAAGNVFPTRINNHVADDLIDWYGVITRCCWTSTDAISQVEGAEGPFVQAEYSAT